MSVASRAILSNLFGEQGRQNHPQYLPGLSRALFPTTFLETAVCSHVPVYLFFFSLQLTLTLLAASICHFHIAALNFKCFFSSTMNLVSFLSFFFLFLFCFVFRSSSFSVIGASLVVVGGNDRTHGQVITNFFCIYRLPFFLSSERELRLYSFSITKSG